MRVSVFIFNVHVFFCRQGGNTERSEAKGGGGGGGVGRGGGGGNSLNLDSQTKLVHIRASVASESGVVSENNAWSAVTRAKHP